MIPMPIMKFTKKWLQNLGQLIFFSIKFELALSNAVGHPGSSNIEYYLLFGIIWYSVGHPGSSVQKKDLGE